MRLIDADAMVQRLEERLKELDKEGVHIAGDGIGSEIRTLREWINTQPTIEANPVRRGRWINDKNDMPMCSTCGYYTPFDHAIDDFEYGNYCPNCGARMEV